MKLILLSGWGVDRRIWQTLSEYWPGNVEPSAVEWPGYGESPALPTPTSIDALAERMAPKLPSDAVWVSWSLGGLLATALLNHLPPPKALLLLGAGSRFCSDGENGGVTSQELTSFQRAFRRDPVATWRHFLRWQAQGEPNAREAHRQLRAQLGETPHADTDTLAQGLMWLETLDNRALLATPPCPIRRLAGAHDPLLPSSTRQQALRLEAAGHCPMLSQPAQLAARLAEQATRALQEPR
ncbi:alpha/beta fold hydrolase [Halomonas sp. CnH100-B]|uniref:alpha/beta fold hydrolase n=1 Tax=Halomonas sp. CnH100-B TaxID=2954490 RepID=UPI002097A8A3|nr:alpha/beta fold hydrolase [Halomonas sp. CnH100-B]MCO7230363.1 alpha/beta fold hydrolase [Halomonas sp. CnH100-B]